MDKVHKLTDSEKRKQKFPKCQVLSDQDCSGWSYETPEQRTVMLTVLAFLCKIIIYRRSKLKSQSIHFEYRQFCRMWVKRVYDS
jgi:hypothetical protein